MSSLILQSVKERFILADESGELRIRTVDPLLAKQMLYQLS